MVVAAAWAFGLSFLVLGNIIGRFAFDAPIYGTAEIVAASRLNSVICVAASGVAANCESSVSEISLDLRLRNSSRSFCGSCVSTGAAAGGGTTAAAVSITDSTLVWGVTRLNYNFQLLLV